MPGSAGCHIPTHTPTPRGRGRKPSRVLGSMLFPMGSQCLDQQGDGSCQVASRVGVQMHAHKHGGHGWCDVEAVEMVVTVRQRWAGWQFFRCGIAHTCPPRPKKKCVSLNRNTWRLDLYLLMVRHHATVHPLWDKSWLSQRS